MPFDDPAEAFTEFGIPPPAAREMSGILRDEVTAKMCDLLPGVERSMAPNGLIVINLALTQVLPQVAAGLVDGLDENRAISAALPGILLYAMTVELAERRESAGGPTPDRPRPSAALAAARRDAQPLIARTLAGTDAPDQAQLMMAMVCKQVREALGPTADREWTGWALLAALRAMDEHDDVLPIPGRTATGPGARRAGAAFQVGRVFALGIAVHLIAGTDAEPPGPDEPAARDEPAAPESPVRDRPGGRWSMLRRRRARGDGGR